MGVQTVVIMAVLFANKEIEWGDQGESGLIISVLIIQFIAVFGAYAFAGLSKKLGNIKVLGMALVIWIFICFAAYFITTPTHFYFLAALVGLVMGGIQALSRSTYSKMLPETQDHASYFSFYEVLEKGGLIIGMFSWGYIEGFTGSMRSSVLALIIFFAASLCFLIAIPKKKTA